MPERLHVAHDLARRFLEGEVEAALAARRPRRRNARPTSICRCRRCRRSARWSRDRSRRRRTWRRGRGRRWKSRSVEASCCSPSDVIGSTLKPVLVDQERIFVGAVRRAAILDDAQPPGRDLVGTRWSSRITQSETYSSMPWRVSVPSPRSPVMIAVTPLSFSQPNSRRSSARSTASFVRPENSALDGVEHDALGADLVDRVASAGRTALRDRTRRSPRFRIRSSGRDRRASLPVGDQRVEVEAQRARRCWRGLRASPRNS